MGAVVDGGRGNGPRTGGGGAGAGRDLPAARVAVVTGATGAIGAQVARRFQSEGWRVVLPVRTRAGDLTRTFPGALVVTAHVHDADDARRVVAEAEEAYGAVDVLVNAAGGFALASAVDTSTEALDHLLEANLRTAAAMTAAVLPDMIRRGSGAVVAISAGAARSGGARSGPYAASKAGLEAYLRAVRAEVAADGVAVGIIVPEGTLDTPANRTAMPEADPARWIAAEAVSDAVWYVATRPPGGRVTELRLAP